MKKTIVLLSMLVVLAALTACQTNPKFEAYNEKVDEEQSAAMKIPIYFWDRLLDLTDIFRVNLSVGDGALANAHFTKALQAGFGYRNAVCFGVMPRSFGMWHEDRIEGGVTFTPMFNFYYMNCERDALWGTKTLFDHNIAYRGSDFQNNDTSHWSSVGVAIHLFVIGADADIIPFEIGDFVLGWFGIPWIIPVDPIGFGTESDVANDDLRAREVRNDHSDLPYYDYTVNPHSFLDPRPPKKNSEKLCEKCGEGNTCSCVGK